LNLKDVPHYSTICKAVKRLKEEGLKKLLEESAKLLDIELEVLAVDSTGLREDNAIAYATLTIQFFRKRIEILKI